MTDVVSYYDKIAEKYAAPTDPYLIKYHEKRFRVAADLLRGLRGSLFDFGCGRGELTKWVGDAFSRIEGCDVAPEMVRLANKLYPTSKIDVGGIDYFLAKPGPFTVVACLNVLPYISEEEEKAFYAHCRNVAEFVLISCGNCLFDLVTLNKYTVQFFRSHLAAFVEKEAMDQLPALLTNANVPRSGTTNASDREIVNKRSVDPFTYQPEGFTIVKMRPLNTFPLPPVILQSRKEWEVKQPDIDIPGTLGKLFSSQFQMLLKRNP